MFETELTEPEQEIVRLKKVINSLLKRIKHTESLSDDADASSQPELACEKNQKSNTNLSKSTDTNVEHSSRVKSEFLATMSHEIRTPMNGVMGMLELLLNTPVNDRQRHLAKTAHDSAEDLLTVINNILDFSKIESGKLSLHDETFDLRQLLDDIITSAAKSAQKKNIGFLTYLPENIEYEAVGDAIRLRQIIVNILDNAIKFTEKGKVEFYVDVETVEKFMHINVTIHDTGKGIELNNQTSIFQPFEQEGVATSARVFGGTGLGLSITHKLIQLMEGDIALQSSPGEGSVFQFNIQLGLGRRFNTDVNTKASSAITNGHNIKLSSEQQNNPRILLAEDNIVNQEIMYEQMAILGYDIEIVANGLQVLEAIKHNVFQLIFMEMHMPHMDGISATEAIRAFERETNRKATPVIAITADSSPGVHAHYKNIGMNDFLIKPLSIDDIEKVINIWLVQSTPMEFQPETTNENTTAESPDILNSEVIEELRSLGQKSGRNTLNNAIKEFKKSSLEQLSTMRSAVKHDNYDEFSSIAHSLKSSSGTIGAHLVYITAAEIEQLAKDKKFYLIPQAVLRLDDQLSQTLRSLDNLGNEKKSIAIPAAPIIGNGEHLLIIDDDLVTLSTLHDSLQNMGYTVDSANSGEKALLLLDKNNYDLVITDLQMPGIDGYALSKTIRKKYSIEKLPILVLTSTSDDVHVKDAYDIGISNFIIKPVNFINLAYTVLFTIQNSRNSHDLWHNRQLLAAAEHTAQLSHWSWEIDQQKLQFSSHLQRYFKNPLAHIKTLDDFIATTGNSSMGAAIKNCLANGKESSWEQEILNPDQKESRFLLHRFRIVTNENENPVLIGTVQEISSIRRAERHIIELAYYDTLTKLNSRSSFNKKLHDLIICSQRRTEKFSLLYIDLDNFKNINDSFGHDIGDKLLIEVANRLRTLSRVNDFACRLGGDEFCILINNIADNFSAAKVAQRCLELLAQPITLAGRKITPHASIGIAIYPNDGDDANFLIKAADTAMYEAKKAGKNQYAFYESAMTDAVHQRLTIENDLRTALSDNQFELYYQPKISLATGKVTSVEALIRWNHPVDGLCPPDSFIPEAEHMGLIIELGRWVVQQACMQIKLWRDQGLENIPVAVNISPKHFEQANFSEEMLKLVNDQGVSPSLIEIEITESTSRNQKVFSNTCQKLRLLGFRVAIDDFGTGYSSLSVLKGAAVDVLKIDREFVRHLPNDTQSSILIGTILGMSKALDLQVVAEGIETEEQLKALVAMGCHMGQGYYFSKPVPAAEIPALTKCRFRRPKPNEKAYIR